VVGIHGFGGTWGALATGLFASKAVNPAGSDGLFFGNAGQLGVQVVSVLATMGFAFVMTLLILKVVDWVAGVRVTDEEEEKGMDISMHDEKGYSY
jgi:Amt family ammonium transporter